MRNGFHADSMRIPRPNKASKQAASQASKQATTTYGSDVLTPSVCIPKIDGVTTFSAVDHG